MSLLSRKTIAKKLLQSKKFRETFVFEHIKRHLPFQIRTMRTEREWSQARAGEAIGKPQNVISRLESPAYGKLTLQTLLDIASGFDVGLLIKFVPFSRLVKEYEDVSFMALSAKSVSDPEEANKLNTWGMEVSPTQATSEIAHVFTQTATRPKGVAAEHIIPLSLRRDFTKNMVLLSAEENEAIARVFEKGDDSTVIPEPFTWAASSAKGLIVSDLVQ